MSIIWLTTQHSPTGDQELVSTSRLLQPSSKELAIY